MRRAPIVLAATIAGTAAVLSFQPSPAVRGAIVEPRLPSMTAAHSANTGIQLGASVTNPYGAVQVQVVKSAGKIVDVRAVRLPDGDGTSREINRAAAPQLKQQALSAQNGSVDGVSGATYTSDGYRRSLQAALDRTSTAGQPRTGAAG